MALNQKAEKKITIAPEIKHDLVDLPTKSNDGA
jgi:hypothetical protein